MRAESWEKKPSGNEGGDWERELSGKDGGDRNCRDTYVENGEWGLEV